MIHNDFLYIKCYVQKTTVLFFNKPNIIFILIQKLDLEFVINDVTKSPIDQKKKKKKNARFNDLIILVYIDNNDDNLKQEKNTMKKINKFNSLIYEMSNALIKSRSTFDDDNDGFNFKGTSQT